MPTTPLACTRKVAEVEPAAEEKEREAEEVEVDEAPSTARSMMVGQVSGADVRLPTRSHCGRVYD